MSWVNLDDVYVNKSGDSIAGNLSVGGALTINDGKGTNTTYNVANEITTLRDSVSHEVFTSYDNGASVTVTPSRDCSILAICVLACTWGYVGGDVKLSIDCPELTAFMRQISYISRGDTIGRDMTSHAIFTGAKNGASYRITRSIIGSPQTHGDQRLFAICL